MRYGVKIDRILEFSYKLISAGIVCQISRDISLNKRYLGVFTFHFNWCIKIS